MSARRAKPGQIDAEAILEEAEQQRREEAAEAAQGTDQSGDRGDAVGEELRHQLEDGTVAGAEQRRAAERADGKRQHRGPHQEQCKRHDSGKHTGEDPGATDPIREDSTDRPHQRREHDESRRPQSGIRHRQAELVAQQRRKVDRKGDEAAEREEVEGRERPRQLLLREHRDHRGHRRWTDSGGRVARQQEEDDGPHGAQRSDSVEHGIAAVSRRDHRTEEHGRRLSDVAEAVDAERGPLLLGRKPTRRKPDTDGK